MAAPQGPTDLTLSAIVDGQEIDAADVVTPFLQAETAIDQARSTLAVSDTDATVKHLADAIQAGSGITITKINAGGDEAIQIINDGGDFASLTDTPASYSGAAYEVPTVNAGETGLAFMPAVPAGCTLPYFGATAPDGWLFANGGWARLDADLRLYNVFFDSGMADRPRATESAITADAATNKILEVGHGLANGDVIAIWNEGGATPGGIVEAKPYFVINAAANDYQVSLTQGGAAVDITSAGSGSNYRTIYFLLPDMRGRGFFGHDVMDRTAAANVVTDPAADQMGGTMGAETHTLTVSEMPSHNHSIDTRDGDGTGSIKRGTGATATTRYTGSQGGGGAHNNMPPVIFGNWIIKR